MAVPYFLKSRTERRLLHGNGRRGKRKIREFLKKVDKKYYRPDIKERKSLSEEMVDAAEETGGTIPPLEEE